MKSDGNAATCSQIFDNGIRIGFATTAPGNIFHFRASGLNNGSWNTYFENFGTTDANVLVQNTSTSSGFRVLLSTNNYNGTAFIPTGLSGFTLATGTGTSGVGVEGAVNTFEGTGVEGTRFDDGGADLGYGGFFFNDLGLTGTFWNFSDKRLKQDIHSISHSLDKVMKLRGVTYTHNTEQFPNMGLAKGLRYGFIAQEVEEVIPEFVKTKGVNTEACAPKSSDGKSGDASSISTFKAVDYVSVVPLLVEAIKEQQAMSEALKIELEILKNR
jgi:hypothetical protein